MPTTNNQVPDQVDARGPRFVAWVTAGVLVAVLLVSAVSPLGAAVLLGAQSVVFAVGAVLGPRRHPYGLVFGRLIAPHLAPVTDKEPAAPLRFAQLVGLVFGLVGVVGFAAGLPLLGLIATGSALTAAFLNAAFGICLGCQLYPLVARLTQTRSNRKELVHGTF
ncbi:DUF4395 domain-containing protein [Mycobacterium sp. IDR2000157661]|uniref:DUF4395 domain-containing protein n=1 Tax=Mycobacterium sp. IDR2000157661 TaxID=2867005 RepID=UPI001EED2324|nr:DUF4395 domain-containing protein [Mycobacterium sp. IDR2000157661]ULE35289.1 DUF4395 domain-containing protein [Mycobacterium sp. IDR2000157661]